MKNRTFLEKTILDTYSEIYTLDAKQKEDIRMAIVSLDDTELENELDLIRDYLASVKHTYQRMIQQIIPKEEVNPNINFAYIF